MKLVISLLIVFVALATGAPTDNEQRVSGGTLQTTAIPYLVSVIVNGDYACGGFIYTKDWVVTAASCLKDFPASQIKVVVGEVSVLVTDTDEQTIQVFKHIINDAYDATTQLNDIALLQLANSITFGATAEAILYDEADDTPGKTGKFAGWGATTNGGPAATKLRTLEMTIPTTCGTYTVDEYNPTYMFCAGDSSKDPGSPCQYDEGSPFVQTIGTASYVVGIMSKNKGCQAGTFEPTIFTRLSAYYRWLQNNAGMQNL